MKTHLRGLLIALALLPLVPATALAGICFSVTGLPVPAAFDLVPMAPWSDGQLPVVGEAHGVCGVATAPATVRGTVTGETDGVARLGFSFLPSSPGCSSGEAEIALAPPYASGSGQVRWPEGSVAHVVLTHDPTGAACAVAAGDLNSSHCIPGPTTLCLQGNRFRVKVDKTRPGQIKADQVLVGSSTSESGLFYFFTSANVDLLVKVLNSCSVNNRYWVFAAASTNVNYRLTVTDTQTGRVKQYVNPLRSPTTPIEDTSAFATCP